MFSLVVQLLLVILTKALAVVLQLPCRAMLVNLVLQELCQVLLQQVLLVQQEQNLTLLLASPLLHKLQMVLVVITFHLLVVVLS